jgi:hypothetical protein
MTDPTGSDADETTPPADEPEAPLPAEADDGTVAKAEDDNAEGDEDDETDEDEGDEDDEEDEAPPARRRAQVVGAILAVIAGLMLGGGLFLPLVSQAGTDAAALTIDFKDPTWLLSLSNLALPFLVVLCGLAVLGGFMRPSVGSGAVIVASLATFLRSAAIFQYLVLNGSQTQVAFASGFWVLAIGSLVGLVAGGMLLAASRRPNG